MVNMLWDVQVRSTVVSVINDDLLAQSVPAVMLSANNTLQAGYGWSLTVQKRGGARYRAECQSAIQAAGPGGLRQGDSVTVYSGDLSKTTPIRWVLQAITIGYEGNTMTPAVPANVYRAVRSALDQAVVMRLGSIATYLMAARSGYAAEPPEIMEAVLCQAILDHAAGGSRVQEIRICETDPARLQMVSDALRLVLALHAARVA